MSTADRQTDEFTALPAREAGWRNGFFARRWRGSASVGTVFWRDMMSVAAGPNLATSFVSLMALGFKAPTRALSRTPPAASRGPRAPRRTDGACHSHSNLKPPVDGLNRHSQR